MKILRSLTTVGVFTMGSRILGFGRDILTAAFLGAGPVADALVVAVKLPSLLRRLLAEGAFNFAFIPMFAGKYADKGKKDAKHFAEEILAVLLVTLIAVVIIIELVMPWLMPIFVPGFRATPERMQLAIQFTRITFPFIIFISLTALYSGILNSIDRFAAVASSPMVGNFFIIVVVLALNPFFKDPGVIVAAGITGCGLVQLLWVMEPCRRQGIILKLRRPSLTPQVKKFLTLMGPAALGSGVYQFNIIIGVAISSLLPIGGVSYLYYAERLNQLPLSMIGTALSTVLLPLLSKQLRAGDLEGARASQNQGIEYALLFTLPATVGLVCLATPLISVLFERGEFGSRESLLTAQALMAYSCGLPAYVMTKIFNTSFYAREDMKTPLKVAIWAVLIDILLSVVLLKPFGHIGIALATAAAAWINATALGCILWKDGFLKFNQTLRYFFPRLLIACAIMLIGLEIAKSQLIFLMGGNTFERLTALCLLVLGGLTAFILLARLTGALNLKELRLQFKSETK
jgi:putative peptidoglycan lipid II flippase